MPTTITSARAIVTRGSHKEGKWKMEDVSLCPIDDEELLVRMVASGICHTDVVFGDNAGDIGGYPRVMGHEGSQTRFLLKHQTIQIFMPLSRTQSIRNFNLLRASILLQSPTS